MLEGLLTTWGEIDGLFCACGAASPIWAVSRVWKVLIVIYPWLGTCPTYWETASQCDKNSIDRDIKTDQCDPNNHGFVKEEKINVCRFAKWLKDVSDHICTLSVCRKDL